MSITGYGLKYYFEYYGIGSLKKRIEIHQKDWSEGNIALSEMGPQPILPTMQAEGSELYEAQIVATSCTVQLYSDTQGQWDQINTSSDDEYVIELYIDGNIKGRWFVIPENTKDEIYNSGYITIIEATDKLGDLSLYTWQEIIDALGEDKYIKWEDVIVEAMKLIQHQQGFRVVNNLIEDTEGTLSNTTPMNRAYIDVKVYDPDTTLDLVIKEMLLSIHASIRSCRGYWYIMRYEEMYQETVTYKEFDSEMVYQTTSSYNPILNFNTHWRWMGRQGKTQELQYKKVTVSTKINSKEAFQDSFEGFLDENDNPVTILGGEIQLLEKYNISHSINLVIPSFEFSDQDLIKIKMEYSISPQISTELSLPYISFFFTIKGGISYYDIRSETWTTSSVIENEVYVNFGDHTLELEITPFFAFSSGTLEIQFKAASWNHAAIELDTSTGIYYDAVTINPPIITTIAALDTVDLPDFSRVVLRQTLVEGFRMLYFELKEYAVPSNNYDVTKITPHDRDQTTNNRSWILVQDNYYDETIINSITFNTITKFKSFNLEFLSGSSGIPSKISNSSVATVGNAVKLEVPIVFHDYNGSYRNYSKTVRNYIRFGFSSQTPSQSWTYAGNTSTIQEHLLRQLILLYQRSRWIVNSQMYSDEVIEPIHVFKVASRILIPLGITFDYGSNQYSGEIKEYTRIIEITEPLEIFGETVEIFGETVEMIP